MAQEKITVEYARHKLGKKGASMSDKEIEETLRLLRQLCCKVLDSLRHE